MSVIQKCPMLHFSTRNVIQCLQLCNVDRKRILRMIFFCLYVDNSTCYVRFNSTMRRHWMTFLVEKCNIGHFCITDIFYAVFLFLVKIKSYCNIMIYDKKRRISVTLFIFSLSDTVFFIRVNFDT
jgi:hypothetical protein